MPAQQANTNPLLKYGDRTDKLISDHAGDDIELGMVSLPPGISNGVAILNKCYFGTYQTGDYKGEAYLRAEGSIIYPEYVDVNGSKVKVKGLHTSVMLPYCQTKKGNGEIVLQSTNIGKIMNELRKLGADTTKMQKASQLLATAEVLQRQKPKFRFVTTPRYDQTDKTKVIGSWENWLGISGVTEALSNINSDSDSEVSDDSATKKTDKPGQSKSPTKSPVKPEPKQEQEETQEELNKPEDLEFNDLDSLVARANEGEQEAIDSLKVMAMKGGWSEEQVLSAETWESVAEFIKEYSGEAEAGEGEEAEEDSIEWSKGETCLYRAPDKSGKPGKEVSCEILSVSLDGLSVTLKNLTTGKVIQQGKNVMLISVKEIRPET